MTAPGTDGQHRARAAAAGQQGWGQHGSAQTHLRYAQPVAPRSRTRCTCGCGTRATHMGMANGVALMDGCELEVRRWARDGYKDPARCEIPSCTCGGTEHDAVPQ